VRAAVREVEEALVALQSAQARRTEAALALQGYAQAQESSSQRYQSGMASLLDLEEARRYALSAESALEALLLERQRAWVSLYRAAGGGWESEGMQATTAPGPKATP
jgi:hypothetical protein